jgi:antitoxin (DNA-binding transcriptional repressor) of toxin-antitoxin stability system
MRKVTIRDLRYRFSAVEDLLREGITKRKRVIARLLPAKAAAPSRRPDFMGRLKKIYRGEPLQVTGAELVSLGRERF